MFTTLAQRCIGLQMDYFRFLGCNSWLEHGKNTCVTRYWVRVKELRVRNTFWFFISLVNKTFKVGCSDQTNLIAIICDLQAK